MADRRAPFQGPNLTANRLLRQSAQPPRRRPIHSRDGDWNPGPTGRRISRQNALATRTERDKMAKSRG